MRLFNHKKLFYAKILDPVARLILWPLKTRNRIGRAPLAQVAPHRILVLESHLIGDVVMAEPALRALRERFPSARVTLVAGSWGEELLKSQSLVDEFYVLRFPWSTYDYSLRNLKKTISVLRRLRKHRWDLGIDLRGDIRNISFLFLTKATRRVSYGFTGGEYLLTDVIQDSFHLKHIVDHNIHLVNQLGCHVRSKEPLLRVEGSEVEKARAFLNVACGTDRHPIIGIHPGASKPLRHWKDDRFASLADMLLEDRRCHVIFFQGPQDEWLIRKITATMKHSPVIISQSLDQLPAIFSCCRLIIGLDSGAVHIAAAVGVPTIVLFGPAEPDRVRPFSNKTSVITKDGYSCRPCDQVHCVQPHDNCMDAIGVLDVYERVVQLLQKEEGQAKVQPSVS